MERAIIFYKPYANSDRRILGVASDPLILTNKDINHYYNKIPQVFGTITGDKYKPGVYMNYCGSDYLLKEGGKVDDTENGKG